MDNLNNQLFYRIFNIMTSFDRHNFVVINLFFKAKPQILNELDI